MTNLPINDKTRKALDSYLTSPGQSLGLIGEKWLNKSLIAKGLAEDLLKIKSGSLDKYPYYLNIGSEDNSSITIDEIRALNNFLLLKVPAKGSTTRVVIIERAERMTLEAQNALLKNLEEPPLSTSFILSAESLTSMLPTIISRLSIIHVYKPSKEDLIDYFKSQGHDLSEINQAMLVADGLPGLVDQLLSRKENCFSEATSQARKLLSSTSFERLSLINDLSKNKEELKNTLFVIKQMAKIGVGSSETKNAIRWQKVLAATLASEKKLNSNVQVKLLLTDYMLSLG